MNTILKQRIEETAKKEREQCRENNNEIWRGNPTYNDVEASFIKGATFALRNQWISVEEALPEEEKKVLVTHQYGCQVAAFYKDGAYSYWGVAKERPIGASITHWMPIPQLPKGGEE